MNFKTIKNSELTGECWTVQMFGTSKCRECEFHKTEECGGEQILKTGKNNKGFFIGEYGLGEKNGDICTTNG